MREEEHSPAARDGLVLGAHWGLLTFFLGIGGYYLLSLVLAAVVLGGGAKFNSLQLTGLGPLVLLAFVPNILLGLLPAIGSWLWGRGLRVDFGLLPTARDVKVGLACGGFALLTGYLINLALIGVYGVQRLDDPLNEMFGGISASVGWLVVAAIIVAVGAPLAEELLVRGALWNGLAHYRVPPWVILVLTSLVFAQLHGEPTRIVALFGQGLAIGAARMITGRTGSSVIAHATNNLPPALLLFIGT